MDDTCAVCAESLDWVAYGACGHKDVCSTCVARLRFICDDRRCCICKTVSDVVFVTKALGDYTKTINDFSLLPSEVKEGRVGQYWYHEDTQTFFDDLDHYKMIKAMCRLSCSVCDKIEDHLDDGFRRRARFRNIEQLKGHLFHKHRLIMCSLCLEGRKVFICEQKLYTRSQLTQHTNTGDSEVDGTESERSGFTGHPMCEFCRTPFYGDNELYTHMSTEHYTCHLCQRQNPSQYNYYKGYDDLEIHFRRDHFVCEDDGCLAKKFIVFLSEAELKRHNTLEHGGRMSRSKRSAALQIPTSFRYRRGSEQENRRGRGHTFRRDPADTELSLAIQASINTDSAPSSSIQPIVDHGDITDFESLIPPIENLAVTDTPSRYLQAVSQSSRNGTLGESSFPPLPLATATNQQNSHPDVNFKKTIAAVSQSSRNGTLGESSFPPLPLASATNKQNSHPDVTSKKTIASVLRSHENKKMHRGSSTSSSAWPAFTQAPTPPTTNPHTWSAVSSGYGLVSSSGQRKSAVEIGDTPSLASSRSTSHMTHSSSAPNLSEREHFGPTVTESSSASAGSVQTRKPPTVDQALNKVENVHTANKSLVEKMRAALGFDEDRFTAFKDISGEYRQGSMDAEMYLSHVDQFGLSHLVLEMARLLPNASRQKELIDAYNLNMACNTSRETILSSSVKHGSGSKKGKGKAVESSSSSTLADNVINTVRQLQSSFTRGTEEEVEVLSKDGYRGGKSKAVVGEPTKSTGGQVEPLPHAGSGPTNRNAGGGDGKSKRKKISKFNRVRLGDGYSETFLDLRNADPDPDPGSSSGTNESLPVRGVWKNGGGKKLLGMASGGSKN